MTTVKLPPGPRAPRTIQLVHALTNPLRGIPRLRERYEPRVERLETRLGENPETEHDTDVAVSARLLAELIEAEREDLRRMRRERSYTVETLREIERELDLDESRLRARIRL